MNYYRMIYATEKKTGENIYEVKTHYSWLVCTEKEEKEVYEYMKKLEEEFNKDMLNIVNQIEDEEYKKRFDNIRWRVYCNPEYPYLLEEIDYNKFKDMLEYV